MGKKQKIKFFGKIILITNLISVVALLLSYLSPFISPEKIWIIAFFGLAYPILFIANLLFVIYWIIRRKKYFLISLLSIIIGSNYITENIQFTKKENPENLKNAIKILSYNVRNFDLYNYKKNWKFNYENRNKIFEFLKNSNADIICLQEIVQIPKSSFVTLDTIVKIQKATNMFVKYSSHHKDNAFGIVIFSRFPIISSGEVSFPSRNNSCIYCDVKINQDTVRIYNVHFESIHLEPQEVQFAEDLSIGENLNNKEILKKNVKKITSFLKKAFIKRAGQARLVHEHIAHSSYPVIFCGDFNDTPVSYTYHQTSIDLKDAFIESGHGIGKTYITKFPFLKIDFILHSKDFETFNFEIPQVKYSDHYPVSCYIRKVAKF